MAEEIKPGMEFARWNSLPSMSETFLKQTSGASFSPLMALAGGALEKMGLGSSTSSKMTGSPANSAPSPNTPEYIPPVQPLAAQVAAPMPVNYQLGQPAIDGTQPTLLDQWSNRFNFGGGKQ